jgi:hypothetical protein
MPVTMEQVRAFLDPEEPDYQQAAQLGPEALPHLEELGEGCMGFREAANTESRRTSPRTALDPGSSLSSIRC